MRDDDVVSGDDLDAIAEYLDGDAPDEVDLEPISKDELAKHLLMASVTRHLLAESSAPLDEKVHEFMEVVVASDQRRRTRIRVLGGLAAAAVILVTAILVYREPPGFKPLLDRVHEFAVSELDREYDVNIQGSNVIAGLFAQGASMQLFLRGTDRYAARIGLDLFGQKLDIWMGSDGEEFWMVPPMIPFLPEAEQPPVIVSNESLDSRWTAGQLGMFEQAAQHVVRIERAWTVLALFEDLEAQYTVAATPKSAAKIPLQPGQQDITAYRHPQADITIPDSIRAIVDVQTGVVQTIVLKFAELPNQFGLQSPLRNVRYDLVRESLDGEGLYEHDAHHLPDRQVIFR